MSAEAVRDRAAEDSEALAKDERSPPRDHLRWLLPGGYAWLLTVLYPALQHGASALARVASFACLFALIASAFVPPKPAWLLRTLGIYAFIGLALITWALLPAELSVDRLDPLRSALGVLGWVMYAFGWGRARASGVPEDDPNVVAGAALHPRSRLSRLTVPIAGFAVASALGLVALAFRVTRPEHATFAHSAATACALLVLGVGTRLALAVGSPRPISSAATRLNAIAPPLALLAVLLGAGLVWAAFAR